MAISGRTFGPADEYDRGLDPVTRQFAPKVRRDRPLGRAGAAVGRDRFDGRRGVPTQITIALPVGLGEWTPYRPDIDVLDGRVGHREIRAGGRFRAFGDRTRQVALVPRELTDRHGVRDFLVADPFGLDRVGEHCYLHTVVARGGHAHAGLPVDDVSSAGEPGEVVRPGEPDRFEVPVVEQSIEPVEVGVLDHGGRWRPSGFNVPVVIEVLIEDPTVDRSMSSDDPRAALARVGERFDLNEYEINAYLAVLEHGQLSASEIADRTDIPQPRVYDTVRSLAERGLVELQESRPIQALAIDPEEAFADAHDSLDTLIADLEARYTQPARTTGAVSLIKSRSSILRYLEATIEAAEYELVCSLTPDLLERFSDQLVAAREADVTVDLLVTPAAEAPDPETFEYEALAARTRARRGITTPVLAVADGSYSTYATQDAVSWDGDRYGVVFNRSALGFLVSGFFHTVLWTTASPLAASGFEGSFPRRYASVRRCIKDLSSLDGLDGLRATVEGRAIESGERLTVEGPIESVSLAADEQSASLSLATDSGTVSVGGRVAAIEDIEAHEIYIQNRPSNGE
jgi:HTH-type transcriptional regulator, sugar sensing transcriptional regulator